MVDMWEEALNEKLHFTMRSDLLQAIVAVKSFLPARRIARTSLIGKWLAQFRNASGVIGWSTCGTRRSNHFVDGFMDCRGTDQVRGANDRRHSLQGQLDYQRGPGVEVPNHVT